MTPRPTTLAILVAWTTTGVAWAEEDCPADDKSCEESRPPPAGTQAGTDAPPALPEQGDPAPDEAPVTEPTPEPEPQAMAPAAPEIVVDRPDSAPKPPRRRRHPRHGINARLEGIVMGRRDSRSDEAGMGGMGASYRFRPVRFFALDAGLDLVLGRDFEGRSRQEAALTVNGILYLNPQHRVQVYFLVGLGAATAEVEGATSARVKAGERDYRYLGVQSGIGLDFVVTRKVALNADVIGFVRGRTDIEAEEQPEFYDPETGRTSNTSGGGLLRAGVTFYFK